MVTTTATAVTAVRRDTWSAGDVPMPAVPGPTAHPAIEHGPEAMEWLNRYEMRPITGALPRAWDGSGDHSLTQLWMRDAPARPLDFARCLHWLTCSSPVWFAPCAPRARRHRVHHRVLHASAEQLAQTGTGYLLGQARGQEFRNGFSTRPCSCGTKPAPCWPPATRSFTKE